MPKELVTRNRNDKHWITPYFKQMIIKRQWAHREGNSALFKIYRAILRHARKYLRKSFYRSEVALLKDSNPMRWWKHTKQIIGQRGDSDASLKALATSICEGDNKKFDNMINKTYQSDNKILPQLDISTLPPPTNSFADKYNITLKMLRNG